MIEIIAPADDCAAARVLLLPTMVPADKGLVARELARLRAVTKHRDSAAADNALVLSAYAEELGEYPADIVVSTLRKLGRSQRFWPALEEIISVMDDAFCWRRSFAAALDDAREPTPAALPQKRLTDEDIDAIFASYGVARPSGFPRIRHVESVLKRRLPAFSFEGVGKPGRIPVPDPTLNTSRINPNVDNRDD